VAKDFRPGSVRPDSSNEERLHAQGLEMPRNVKRSTTENLGTIGVDVEEDFPDD
jgi:hypothetical protein